MAHVGSVGAPGGQPPGAPRSGIPSRKKGEAVVVGNRITVTILEVQAGRVKKLGFTAPAEGPIHREEVFEHIGDAWPDLEVPVPQ